MFSEAWSRVLVASVTPVVVISASGLLCLAFYNRLATIVARLRGLQRERLEEMERVRGLPDGGDGVHRRVLRGLEVQTRRIVVRARLIRLTLMCLLAAIGLLILSSILYGVSVFWPEAAVGAAGMFLLGMLSLLCATGAAMAEMARSLDVVEFECESVSELALECDDGAEGTARERLRV